MRRYRDFRSPGDGKSRYARQWIPAQSVVSTTFASAAARWTAAMPFLAIALLGYDSPVGDDLAVAGLEPEPELALLVLVDLERRRATGTPSPVLVGNPRIYLPVGGVQSPRQGTWNRRGRGAAATRHARRQALRHPENAPRLRCRPSPGTPAEGHAHERGVRRRSRRRRPQPRSAQRPAGPMSSCGCPPTAPTCRCSAPRPRAWPRVSTSPSTTSRTCASRSARPARMVLPEADEGSDLVCRFYIGPGG